MSHSAHWTAHCRYCGELFSAAPSNHRQFCSAKCFHAYRRGLPLGRRKIVVSHCAQCGIEIIDNLAHTFCSLPCKAAWQSEHQRGPNNPNWKPTKTLCPSNKHSLRRHIKARDKVCQDCGAPKNLQVHHVDGDPTNNDDGNLVLLCKPCHARRHIERGEPDEARLVLTCRIYRHKTPKTCSICEMTFIPRRDTDRYCSDACADRARTLSRKGRTPWNKNINNVSLICHTCGKTFSRSKGRLASRKGVPRFCSKACQIRYAVNRRLGVE